MREEKGGGVRKRGGEKEKRKRDGSERGEMRDGCLQSDKYFSLLSPSIVGLHSDVLVWINP